MTVNTLIAAPALPTANTAAPATVPVAVAAQEPAVAAAPAAIAPPADTNQIASPSGATSSVPLPASEGSSIEAAKVAGAAFSSIGDPHETTGDGLKFDNQKPGDFIKLRAKSGDFELQTRHEPWDKNPQAMVNTMVGVKLNGQGDKVVYDAKRDTLSFNGKAITVEEGKDFTIPGGGTISKGADGYTITSAKGDKVSVNDRGSYCDVTGEVSADRVDGDVAGALGAIDSDADFRNDLVGRDGEQLESTDALTEAWRVEDGEGLLDAQGAQPAAPDAAATPVAAEGAAPVDGAAAPAEGQDPVATLVADIKQLIGQLKADPKNAQNLPLLQQIEGLLDGAGKNEEAPKAALGEVVQQAPATDDPDMAQLLAMLKHLIELLAQQIEAATAKA